MDALLTTDDSGGSVQDSENAIPAVSANTSVVLIWRVQSPDPLGDSLLLREQLVSKLTWNVFEGFIPKPDWDSPSTYSVQKRPFCTYYKFYTYLQLIIRCQTISNSHNFHYCPSMLPENSIQHFHQVSLPVWNSNVLWNIQWYSQVLSHLFACQGKVINVKDNI